MKYAEFFRLIENKDHLIKRANMTDGQKDDVIDFFNQHPNYEKELGDKWNKPELLTWDDFEEIMTKERVSKSQLKNFVKDGTHYIKFYEDDNIAVYQPLTWMGARYLASKDVFPRIEGEWCISYQKERTYWDTYSFNKSRVFLVISTATTKYALEIAQEGFIYYWDSGDNDITEETFLQRISSEVPNIKDILKEYAPKAIANFNLVKNLHDRDLQDTKIFEELQKKAEEERIKSFPKSFRRQVAKKGYYLWDRDLTSKDVKAYGLISEDGNHLDERIKLFKVKGEYLLNELDIEEAIWPLDIESGVFSMRNCTMLSSVTIPDYITSIREYAFCESYSIKSVTIPNSVTSIGNEAFYGCEDLTEITIPNSVTSIGDYAFSNCVSLTKITIPEGVTSIGKSTFKRCESLEDVIIPDSVTSIGNEAFNGCESLEEITLPNSVTSLGDFAFVGCSSLRDVTLSKSVTSINLGTFMGCSSLKGIKIPNSVTTIEKRAFYRCNSLESAYIGNGVTSIGDEAFYDCSNLKAVVLGNSVKSIGYNTFEECISLKGITIPNSVNSIGERAFDYCDSLEVVNIDKPKDSLELWYSGIPSTAKINWKGEFTSKGILLKKKP